MSEQKSPNHRKDHRTGMVALVGRPNVGKSTLMNALVGEKISIITPVAQTTRNQIRGIQNLPYAQILYLDTPGIHHPRKALNKYMVDVALRALLEVDLIFYLIDASRPDPAVMPSSSSEDHLRNPGFREDILILEQLGRSSVPIFLVVNKIDLITEKTLLLPLIAHYSQHLAFEEVIPISASTEEGLEILLNETIKRLPTAPPLFSSDYSTDMAERFLVSEIIREKLILHTRQELPHSTAVIIDSFDESERIPGSTTTATPSGVTSLEALARELVTPPELLNEEEQQAAEDALQLMTDLQAQESAELHDSIHTHNLPTSSPVNPTSPSTAELRPGLVRIDATIVVERSSQKGIVIGKQGSRLKQIGTEARLDIEALLGCRVFLQLWVRVAKNWSQDEKALRKLGYRE